MRARYLSSFLNSWTNWYHWVWFVIVRWDSRSFTKSVNASRLFLSCLSRYFFLSLWSFLSSALMNKSKAIKRSSGSACLHRGWSAKISFTSCHFVLQDITTPSSLANSWLSVFLAWFLRGSDLDESEHESSSCWSPSRGFVGSTRWASNSALSFSTASSLWRWASAVYSFRRSSI